MRPTPAGSRVAAATAALMIAVSAPAATAPADRAGGETPRIHPGAIELGLAGATSSAGHGVDAAVAIRGGTFLPGEPGRIGLEIEGRWERVRELDRLDVMGALSWGRPAGNSAAHPYLAAAAGIRQEWLGSFRQGRFPIGGAVGVRVLFSDRVALRTEYRTRRVLGDPVGGFTEHGLDVGLSLFFRNESGSSPVDLTDPPW